MIVIAALVVILAVLAIAAAVCDRLPWPDPAYDTTEEFSAELGAVRRAVRGVR